MHLQKAGNHKDKQNWQKIRTFKNINWMTFTISKCHPKFKLNIRLLIPFMIHRRISSFDKTINTAQPPTGNSNSGRKNSSQIFIATPFGTIPPFMHHIVVIAREEYINSVGAHETAPGLSYKPDPKSSQLLQ